MCNQQIGRETLEEEFTQMLNKNKDAKGHDDIYDKLTEEVRAKSMNKHEWEEKAEESLVSL